MCPKYVSDGGVFSPAKEKVALVNYGKPFKNEKTGEMVNTGDPYIYEGPDRAALLELWRNDPKSSTMGRSFKTDPTFIQMVKQLGHKDVEEYLNIVGYDEKEEKKKFEEEASVVNRHEMSKKVKFAQNFTGGTEGAGAGYDYGAFDMPPGYK